MVSVVVVVVVGRQPKSLLSFAALLIFYSQWQVGFSRVITKEKTFSILQCKFSFLAQIQEILPSPPYLSENYILVFYIYIGDVNHKTPFASKMKKLINYI